MSLCVAPLVMAVEMYSLLLFLSIFTGLTLTTLVLGYLGFVLYRRYRAALEVTQAPSNEGKPADMPYINREPRSGGDTLITDD